MQQNKKENICEFSIIGNKITEEKLNPIIEEFFENSYYQYKYDVTTYQLLYRSREGINNLNNVIEIHNNVNDERESKEYCLDTNIFYNNIDILEKIDDYFNFSSMFIKYIANTIVNFPMGYASIVEFARCEDKVHQLFLKIGYREKCTIRRNGEIFKYKNMPIILFSNNLSLTHEYDKESKKLISKKEDFGHVIELVCYCKESEKEYYWKIMEEIKTKLSNYIHFHERQK